MPSTVTVAIPTRNAGPHFTRTLAAIAAQRLDAGELELLICDSGSSDGTVALARSHGAEVIEIAPEQFSHGGTRNLLMSRAHGDHVALLTQDAVPESADWLAALLAAFTLAPDVGLVFGPYRPQPGASVSVARELTGWFASFSNNGEGGPRIDALAPDARDAPARSFMGHRGFFTDANGCVARAAWQQVPFREVAYAEDHLLAQDMLRAGFAKVYVPEAAVLHSHEYTALQWLGRSFDEARAVHEVYGFSLTARAALQNVRGGVSGDRRWARAHDDDAGARLLAASFIHHTARAAGGLLGGRAGRLPASVSRRLSLERRA